MADIVVILYLILCLYGMKYCKGKGNFYDDYLSKENTIILKGIFCLAVVFHHISQRFTPLPRLTQVFLDAGPWAVMLFFFISGYGVMINYINKPNYDEGFIQKRFRTILPLYIVAICLYWIVDELFGIHYSIFGVIHSLIDGSPIVEHSWYILVILAFYVIFYLQMKVFKKNYIAIILSSILFSYLWIQIRAILGFGGWWSNYIYSLPLGMIWALYKEKIDKVCKKYYWILLIGFFADFMIHWKYLIFNNTRLETLAFKGNIYRISIVFPILVMLINMKFKFGNKLLKHIGQISMEVYMFHGMIVSVILTSLSIPERNGFIYSLLGITLSIIFATIIHYAYKKVINIIKNKRDKKTPNGV